MDHTTRVLIWTQVLASIVSEEGLSVDTDVLGWAAAIHDTQRRHDGIDAEHGLRAATWIENKPRLLPTSVPLHRVTYLCRWHVPLDCEAPEMTEELMVFKDADALDRWRIADLDPTFLRTEAAHRLLDPSRDLWAATSEPHHADYSTILAAATKLEILDPDPA